MELPVTQLTFKNICRTCMSTSNDLNSLFDYIEIGSEKIELNIALLKCTSVEVLKDDEYSHSICKYCKEKLVNFYLFREECFQTNFKFRELYQASHNNKHNECIHDIAKAEHFNDSENLNRSTINDDLFIDVKKSFPNEECCDLFSETMPVSLEDTQLAEVISVKEKSCDEKTGTFVCSICNKMFGSKYSLNEHNKIHLGADKFKCKLCGKQFTRIGDVSRHMVTHTGMKPYSCSICNKSFTQSGSLSIHMKKHNITKQQEKKGKQVNEHLCSVCGKKFSKAFSLTVHLRRHLGERPYKCNFCEMRFVTSSRLTSHSRTHTGERPFKCRYCDKTFSHSTVMNTHVKTHLMVKPHQCSYCPKRFSALHELNVHSRQHTGEKPFKCTICTKKFSSNKNLKEHMKTHTQEKSHLCTICGKSFRRSNHLKNHMKTHKTES